MLGEGVRKGIRNIELESNNVEKSRTMRTGRGRNTMDFEMSDEITEVITLLKY